MRSKKSFWYYNSLSITLFLLFMVTLTGQILTGWNVYDQELHDKNIPGVSLGVYLTSGHFIQATFENWESEFFQMAAYVLLTISLRQRGSSESKSFEEQEEVDREPDPAKKDAPWAVKKGGWYLKIYKNSLSIAFGILFVISFCLHVTGSFRDYNEKQRLEGRAEIFLADYLGHSRLWFESFQNWQSEFVAVISIVLLSIYLRQFGSPESKPVDASCEETGSG